MGDLSELSWLLFSTTRISSASTVPGWWQAEQQVEFLPRTGMFVLQCCFHPWAPIIKWWPLKRDSLRNSVQVYVCLCHCRTLESRGQQSKQVNLTVLLHIQERLTRSVWWPTRSLSGVLRVKAMFWTSTGVSLGWVLDVGCRYQNSRYCIKWELTRSD